MKATLGGGLGEGSRQLARVRVQSRRQSEGRVQVDESAAKLGFVLEFTTCMYHCGEQV